MQLTAIAAVSDNWVIGKGNDLPWHIPEDLKRFKAFTKGKWMVMGRATWESIGKRPLPGRPAIVVSRTLGDDDKATVVTSLQAAIDHAKAAGADELVVCGGGRLYTEALPLVDVVSLTRVHLTIDDGEAFFPAFDGEGFAKRVSDPFVSNDVSCTYEEWKRV